MKFQEIHYINLEKDVRRRARIESQIARSFSSTPCRRFDAVSAATLEPHQLFVEGRLAPQLCRPGGGYRHPGTIACFVSHYLVLKKILDCVRSDGPGEPFLVLEDDCVFSSGAARYVLGLGDDQLPPDWAVLKHSLGRRDPTHRVDKFFYSASAAVDTPWNWYWGTHFMIYNPLAVPGIVAKMESGPVYAFDGWVKRELNHVYSFARRVWIRQSNLGGSNTNPEWVNPTLNQRLRSFLSPDHR